MKAPNGEAETALFRTPGCSFGSLFQRLKNTEMKYSVLKQDVIVLVAFFHINLRILIDFRFTFIHK